MSLTAFILFMIILWTLPVSHGQNMCQNVDDVMSVNFIIITMKKDKQKKSTAAVSCEKMKELKQHNKIN